MWSVKKTHPVLNSAHSSFSDTDTPSRDTEFITGMRLFYFLYSLVVRWKYVYIETQAITARGMKGKPKCKENNLSQRHYPPQIPHGLGWEGNWAAVFRNRRLPPPSQVFIILLKERSSTTMWSWWYTEYEAVLFNNYVSVSVNITLSVTSLKTCCELICFRFAVICECYYINADYWYVVLPTAKFTAHSQNIFNLLKPSGNFTYHHV
jgi:hypothetical protein